MRHAISSFTLLCSMALFATAPASFARAEGRVSCSHEEDLVHPALCHWIDVAATNVEAFAQHAHAWAVKYGLLVNFSLDRREDVLAVQRRRSLRSSREKKQLNATFQSVDHEDHEPLESTTKNLPIVFAHGMGDACGNDGIAQLVDLTSRLVNAYTVCIPTSDNHDDDTRNGFFLNWNATVDVFAQRVAQDPRLQNGFHAIGFSQGSNIIRGYIARYNTPAVHTFISTNGVNAGIGAVPYCRSNLSSNQSLSFSICDMLMEQASRSAYTAFAQEHSFQANYWRDPRAEETVLYHAYSQLAWFNNEGSSINEAFRENWNKTEKFVWILAENDEMVWPREGEQWGAPDPKDPFNHILPMQQTRWYQEDLFGLRTSEEAGKNHYESFAGDHLRFTLDDYERWVQTYLVQ